MIHVTRDWKARHEGYFERDVKYILERAFIGSSFFAYSETSKYRPSEDEVVWKQNRGDIPEVVEVYHKGEWLCDVHSKMSRDEMVNKVYKVLQLKKLAILQKENEQNSITKPSSS